MAKKVDRVDTSLTAESVRKFLEDAETNKRLYCNKIQGFHVRQAVNKPVYGFRYRDATSKRRDIKIGNVKDTKLTAAALVAAEWRADLIKGEKDPFTKREGMAAEIAQSRREKQTRGVLRIGTYIDIYERALADKCGETLARNTINTIKKHFQSLFDRDMDTITKTDIREWEALKKRDKKPVARTTLQAYYSTFKTMLNFAAGMKKDHANDNPVLEVNPLANVYLSDKTKADRDDDEAREDELNLRRDLLTHEERQKLKAGLEAFAEEIRQQRRSSRKHGKPHLPDLDTIPYPHWFIPFCHIARLTGMRPGDILSLRWQDIQTHLRTKTQILSFTPNKTRHHNNPIKINFPIAGEVAGIFKTLHEQNGKPKTGFIIRSDRGNGGEKLNRHSYKSHWRRTKELAELRPEIQFYSFRHNFISDLLQRGVPVMTIAGLVGHRDGTMIANNYMRHSPDIMADVVAAFAEGWNENPNKLQVKA